jgi:tetratricopeptide (TPR) repeat protein
VGNVSLRRFVRSFSLRAMSFLRCSVLACCLALAGCHPGSQGISDEQKEPYFLAAKKRNQERDTRGAIEYFEKALDVNPRSASAHFELGILYEGQEPPDYAASLYHYKRCLDIRPDFQAADIIKQHMETCKRELAKSVVQLPTTEALQKKVEALTQENQFLKAKLDAWQLYYSGGGPAVTNTPSAAARSNSSTQQRPAAPTNAFRADAGAATPRADTPSRNTASTSRMHTVSAGETLGSIAKKYGVKLTSLQAANPTIDARRLRPGQALVIPSGQ